MTPPPDTADLPPPGSPEAAALGCSCHAASNRHGAGSGHRHPDGTPMYWYDCTCPIHGDDLPAAAGGRAAGERWIL
jgi:hypothetical protein